MISFFVIVVRAGERADALAEVVGDVMTALSSTGAHMFIRIWCGIVYVVFM